MRATLGLGSQLALLLAMTACRDAQPTTSPAPSPVASGASPAPPAAAAPSRATDDDLVGLWKARRRFGPDARGPLIVHRSPAGWTADFVGQLRPVTAERGELAFELPGGAGGFRGHLAPDGRRIAGHWTPPPSVIHGVRFAVPVVLDADRADRWRSGTGMAGKIVARPVPY